MHWGDIEQITQDEVKPKIILYNIHKRINEETYVKMAQRYNNPCTGHMYI